MRTWELEYHLTTSDLSALAATNLTSKRSTLLRLHTRTWRPMFMLNYIRTTVYDLVQCVLSITDVTHREDLPLPSFASSSLLRETAQGRSCRMKRVYTPQGGSVGLENLLPLRRNSVLR